MKTDDNKKATLETKRNEQIKKFRNNQKAFTLIELIAVIVILAILMIIAIPSVSTYISDSRKKAYIASAKSYIDGTRFLLSKGKIDAYDPAATYYIPAHCVKMENNENSPYGKWKDRYVGVTYSDNKGFRYYWESTDMSEMGINLVAEKDLTVDKIENGIKEVLPVSKINNTSKVLVLSDTCSFDEWIDVTAPEPDPDDKPIRIDATTWYKKPMTFKLQLGACYLDGGMRNCGVTVIVMNDGDTVLSDWVASFTMPGNISIIENNVSYASVAAYGDKIKFTSSPDAWNFIQPYSSKSGQMRILIDPSVSLSLDDAAMDFSFLTDDVQQGEVSVGVLVGDAEDMNIDLPTINVELKRNNYWSDGGIYGAIYGVIITNLSDNDINDWSFKLILPPEITSIDAWGVTATDLGNSTYRITGAGYNNNVSAHGTTRSISAFQFNMTDINAMPRIE